MALDILEFGVKLSVLLGIGGALTVSMRRRSAAARHLVWTLTVIGTLALPFASLAGPRWTLPIRRAVMPALGVQGLASTESASTVPTATDTGTRDALAEPPAQGQTTWAAAAIAIYVAGLLLLLTRLLLDYSHVHRVVARASVIDDGAWVDLMKTCANRLNIARQPRLLFGHDDVVPVAAGAIAADIVLPSTAQAWDANRRRSVLLHELAHVARRDCLTQLLAEIAVALYWPHPGVWWAARRLRVERELACDDRVLSCDMPADVYAEQLLELAYAHSRHRTPALAVTMARPGQLEGRMRALMEHRRNRATPNAGWRLAATAAAGVAVLTLAATTVAVVPIAPVAAAESASQGPAQSTGLAASLPPGTWQLRRLPDGRSIQITVSEREGSYHGGVLRIDRFDGLAAALAGDGRGLVQFRLKRDAGTFAFEGTLRDGIGGGTVTFLPDATFPDALAKRGFDRPMLIQQVILAAADIGFDFVDALAAERYSRPTLDQLVNAGQHGVNGTDIKELAALGYRLETVDGLVRFHDHGVSPNYVRDLRGQGLDRLSADDRCGSHGSCSDPSRSPC